MVPHYIAQIVPAPPGWLRNGSSDPGDEFWYTSTDGKAEVYPDEYSGWILRNCHTDGETHHADPQSAFAAWSQ